MNRAEGWSPEAESGTWPEARAEDAEGPDAEVEDGPADRAPRGRDDPEAFRSEDGPGHDPRGVQDRRQRIEEEAAVGDEDLADTDRRREQDLGEAVDPQQIDIEVACGLVEAHADGRCQQ